MGFLLFADYVSTELGIIFNAVTAVYPLWFARHATEVSNIAALIVVIWDFVVPVGKPIDAMLGQSTGDWLGSDLRFVTLRSVN